MNKETLKIKKRGEDGNKIISVRIKEDILNILDSSQEVKTEEIKNNFTKRLISSLVRIFAPLL